MITGTRQAFVDASSLSSYVNGKSQPHIPTRAAGRRGVARDEAHRQLEFLEGELEGVRASERALIEENKALQSALTETTASRDGFEAAATAHADIVSATALPDSGRVLYLLRRR